MPALFWQISSTSSAGVVPAPQEVGGGVVVTSFQILSTVKADFAKLG